MEFYNGNKLKRPVRLSESTRKFAFDSLNRKYGLDTLKTESVSLGGFFVQSDIVDASVLREAQKNPESYKTLSVRVSGWNARFITLDKEWQEMVIEQNL